MTNIDQSLYDNEVKNNYQIAKKIYNKLNFGGSEIIAYQHIISVINLFFSVQYKEKDLLNIIFDCTEDGQLDAILISQNVVYIFDVKRSDKFDSKDIKLFVDSVEKIFFQNILPPNLITQLKDKIKKIRRIKNKKIKLIIFRNTQNKIPSDDFKNLNKYVSFGGVEFVNVNSLIKKITEDKINFPTLKINVKDVGVIDDGKPEKEELLLKIPIVAIIKHKEFGEKNGLDLFYKNVRNPNMDSGFKAELVETLQKNKEKFHLLHNGITIISKRITINSGNFEIECPQIINGAQTIGCLHQVFNENPDYLKGVMIFCKILKADKELAKKVCETSNVQKQVYIWELRAHDDLHIKLGKYIASNTGEVLYLRKNAKDKGLKGKKIKLDLFIQLVYAAIFKKPWFVKTNKKKLFRDPTENSSIYNKIQKNLENCDISCIDRLIKSALVIDKFIINYEEKARGFLRDIKFYLIAFSYQKNTFDSKDIEEVYLFLLKEVQKLKRHKNNNLNNNKILNQSEDLIWKKLSKKYALK